MILRDFFRMCHEGQQACLILCDYHICSTIEALNCLLSEDALNSNVKSVEAEEKSTLCIFAEPDESIFQKEANHGTEKDC